MHKFFLCLRYLRKRRIAFFGTVAVSLCVALLIVITSLFNGFIDSYLEHSQRFFGQVILFCPQEIDDYQGLVSHLETYPAIKTARAKLHTSGLLYMGKGDVRGVEVVGIDPIQMQRDEDFQAGLVIKDSQQKSAFVLDQATRARARAWMRRKLRREVADEDLPIGAIVGIGLVAQPDELTDEYNRQAITQDFSERQTPMVLTVGQTRQSDHDRQSPTRLQKRSVVCWPVNVVQTGQHLVDTTTIYLPLEMVKQIKGTSPGQIQITGKDSYNLETVMSDVWRGWRQYAGQTLRLPEEMIQETMVLPSREMKQVKIITQEIRKQLVIMQVILGFICAVTMLLIFVILLMIVMQKRKDIGIIRALGSSRAGVAALFLGYGGGIGTVGTLLGLALGVWATRNINLLENCLTQLLGFKIWKSGVYMFSDIPNQVDWSSVLWIVLVGIATAVIGAVLPAWRAARMLPVDALRYE